jgi:hypothetical protein
MRILILVIILSLSFISPEPSRAQSSEGVTLICTVSAVPYGYVVVGKTSTEQCRSNIELPERDNTYMIKRPASKETICQNSPYPSDYAVTGRARLSTCPSTGNETDNNAWVISRLK